MSIRTIITVLLCAAAAAASAQAVHTASGRVERFENFPSRYVDPRTVDVWLPAGYDGQKKFAVLYMHDGRMLFDTAVAQREEWGVDETMGPLMARGTIQNTIVVGVWTSNVKRHIEYFPQQPFAMLDDSLQHRMLAMDAKSPNAPADVHPISDKYLRFLVTELKPFIDSAFSTHPDRQHTFVAGSSMGGLISMYAICEYPEVFGGAACFSTHWVGSGWGAGNPIPGVFLRYLNERLPAPASHKIYFDHGTRGLDSLYIPSQLRADAIMRAKGYTAANWMSREFPGDDHSERAWKRRFNIPITFLLGR